MMPGCWKPISWAVIFVGMLGGAQAASFDCSRAQSPDERAVCSNPRLNDMDVEMTVKYHFLQGGLAMGAAGELADSQRDWLTARARCAGNVQCLTKVYRERLSALDEVYGALNKPF